MNFGENIQKDNVADYFSHSVRYWEEIYGDTPGRGDEFSRYAKIRRKGIVLDYLDRYTKQRPMAVLDIGCGPGVLLEEVLRRGHTVSGIDISEEMVRKANKRLGRRRPGNVACRQGDIEDLPFGDGTIDVVLCLGVLPYLADDGQAVREIDRVLKGGGVAIVVLPNILKLGSLLDPYYYLVRVWQYLWYRLINRNIAANISLKPDSFGSNREFNIRRYTRRQAIGLFSGFGNFIEKGMTGIEFGPLTFWKRTLLTDQLSIKLSELFSKQSGKWTLLTYLPNEWVICFMKREGGGER